MIKLVEDDIKCAINLKHTEDGVIFEVKLSPNSSKNQIQGVENNLLKVQTTVIPENGKANKALIKILSKELKIAKSNIEIIKGLKSKNKTVLIKGKSITEMENLF